MGAVQDAVAAVREVVLATGALEAASAVSEAVGAVQDVAAAVRVVVLAVEAQEAAVAVPEAAAMARAVAVATLGCRFLCVSNAAPGRTGMPYAAG